MFLYRIKQVKRVITIRLARLYKHNNDHEKNCFKIHIYRLINRTRSGFSFTVPDRFDKNNPICITLRGKEKVRAWGSGGGGGGGGCRVLCPSTRLIEKVRLKHYNCRKIPISLLTQSVNPKSTKNQGKKNVLEKKNFADLKILEEKKRKKFFIE